MMATDSTPSLNLSPPSPGPFSLPLPLLKMDMATKSSVELAVTEILRSSDMDSVTEAQVRAMAAAKLRLDLSDLSFKILVRQTIDSFLLSTAPSADDVAEKVAAVVAEIAKSGDLDVLTVREVLDLVRGKVGLDVFVLPHSDVIRQVMKAFFESSSGGDAAAPAGGAVEEILKSLETRMRDVLAMVGERFGLGKVRDSLFKSGVNHIHNEGGEEEDTKPVISPVAKPSPAASDCCRVICKLSNKRDVAVRGSAEKTVVSIREIFWKDGKQMPSPRGISLSNDQWSTFRKSIPAIEEAIQKVESRLRSELERKQAEDKQDRFQNEGKQNDGTHSRAKLEQNGTHHGCRPMPTGEHVEAAGSAPQGVIPIWIIRFDGKSYRQWADCMESYLNHLKIAYVLSEPCPSAVGVVDRGLGQTLVAVRKWIDDDHICRQNILHSLCDNLFAHYSKKSGTAKDLWEELKLIYLSEEYGAKVSLVKKYIEFQMVEEKSIFEQVQELHEIADSLIASGMYVEEKFHVNVIISKLPPSWKPLSIQLMKEDFLPVWMLMNLLKAEEENRGKGDKGEAVLPRPEVPISQPDKRLGPQRIPMKRPGVPHANHEPDRDRRIKFCTVCKKKGHAMEQCWFRKSGGKGTTPSENDNAGSAQIITGRDMDGVTD